MTRNHISLGVLTVGAGLLAAATVSPSSARISRVSAGGTFRMNISGSDVQSLDPALDYEVFGGQITRRSRRPSARCEIALHLEGILKDGGEIPAPSGPGVYVERKSPAAG